MGIHDEKTKPATRAVKRRATASDPEASQPTKQTKAVRRRKPPPDAAAHLEGRVRVQLLPRAELRNAAGEPDNGWVVRDEHEKQECLRFVLEPEPLLKTVARGLFKADDYFFDVMADDANVGALQLEAVHPGSSGLGTRVPPSEGLGRLFDVEGQERAVFVVRPEYRLAAFDSAQRLLFELKRERDGDRVMAGRAALATVRTLHSEGLLGGRHLGLELVLIPAATPFQRLCVVAGLIANEAWLLERERYRSRQRSDGLSFSLGSLLFD